MSTRTNQHHQQLMSGYYAAREAEEREAEAQSLGYATELSEWWQDHPRITFKEWLINQRS